MNHNVPSKGASALRVKLEAILPHGILPTQEVLFVSNSSLLFEGVPG